MSEPDIEASALTGGVMASAVRVGQTVRRAAIRAFHDASAGFVAPDHGTTPSRPIRPAGTKR
jgi:hypothetical protein